MEDRDPGSPSGWERLLAPLRSEDAAFRSVLWVLVACVVIAVIAVILRAIL
ncbi:unannotated protein [freshwater metagenome]|uniref:Unannotated protein n=1 Tax=freshwater metagenome TaxID=449393 RepID=A0A6J7DQY7_9ZZZZ|nr:hypothetical protein [Actinomycetota bacterium]